MDDMCVKPFFLGYQDKLLGKFLIIHEDFIVRELSRSGR